MTHAGDAPGNDVGTHTVGDLVADEAQHGPPSLEDDVQNLRRRQRTTRPRSRARRRRFYFAEDYHRIPRPGPQRLLPNPHRRPLPARSAVTPLHTDQDPDTGAAGLPVS